MFVYVPKYPVLDEDVLFHIFEHQSDPHTLGTAALVSRAWRYPAQAALYQDLVYSIIDNRRRDLLLARTMRMHPHLRRHVRRLRLVTLFTHSPTPALCDWIAHMPPNRLHEFHWTWHRGHIIPAILSYPAVKTAPRIILDGSLYDARMLQPLLELPQLRSLSIELTGCEPGSLYIPEIKSLQHLDLNLKDQYGPVVEKVLAAVGSSLQSLRLACKLAVPEHDEPLIAAIQTHCRNLTRFDIKAFPASATLVPIPFLDQFVQRYPELEHLRCTECTFSDDMFANLPSALKTLEIVLPRGCASLPQKEALLKLVKDRARASQSKLTSVAIYGSSVLEDCTVVRDACRESGVSYELVIDDEEEA